jgi:GTPase SAR1 family protein
VPTAKLTRETGDVGGQKTLRTYWKNYFEKTDTLIWVVDGTDRERIDDCRQELEGLLVQEVKASARSDKAETDQNDSD